MLNWMRNPELVGLPNIATGLVECCEYLKAQIPLGIMYELGSFAGESTEVFARYFAIVHAVDPWEKLMRCAARTGGKFLRCAGEGYREHHQAQMHVRGRGAERGSGNA